MHDIPEFELDQVAQSEDRIAWISPICPLARQPSRSFR
ncbi:hypothetical protein FOC4_g10006379 [Fusarium odoratissimum]|uniref:Uncharacterized protein n=3 Tax=Fusarium oxysporum species complex TaxID=171631 RepID=N1RED5_FUSC4|nr:hypothetical protein FOC4_g10006379 [Fusarium odoratissimum]ENH75875.1 hypothetical protein FOC1_g10003012 [Fusarium oxysporum f. sp. cubense race 1]